MIIKVGGLEPLGPIGVYAYGVCSSVRPSVPAWAHNVVFVYYKCETNLGNLSLNVAKFTYNEMSYISTYFPIITSEH